MEKQGEERENEERKIRDESEERRWKRKRGEKMRRK